MIRTLLITLFLAASLVSISTDAAPNRECLEADDILCNSQCETGDPDFDFLHCVTGSSRVCFDGPNSCGDSSATSGWCDGCVEGGGL